MPENSLKTITILQVRVLKVAAFDLSPVLKTEQVFKMYDDRMCLLASFLYLYTFDPYL